MSSEHQGYLVVSTVPTVGYLIMNGLIQIAVFVACLFAVHYLLKKTGFDILSFLRNDNSNTKENKNESDSNSSKTDEKRKVKINDKKGTRQAEETTSTDV